MLGFDDSPLAGLAHVDLTTVGQDSCRSRGWAVARAVDRIDGPMVTPPFDVPLRAAAGRAGVDSRSAAVTGQALTSGAPSPRRGRRRR